MENILLDLIGCLWRFQIRDQHRASLWLQSILRKLWHSYCTRYSGCIPWQWQLLITWSFLHQDFLGWAVWLQELAILSMSRVPATWLALWKLRDWVVVLADWARSAVRVNETCLFQMKCPHQHLSVNRSLRVSHRDINQVTDFMLTWHMKFGKTWLVLAAQFLVYLMVDLGGG